MNSESHKSFFRQSGWLVVANAASGFFMAAVHVIANRVIEPAEYSVFGTLLRVLLLIGIPAAGLQTVVTQQTAASGDAERPALAASTRRVAQIIFILWLGALVAVWFGQRHWLAQLKIANPAALWVTALSGLLFLWLPLVRGVLQGRQDFGGLGWVMVLDGVGRLLAVSCIWALGGQAAGGLAGAATGQAVALLLGLWLTRQLWRTSAAAPDWRPWKRVFLPLLLGPGAVVVMMNTDVVVVQWLFPAAQSGFYIAAAMAGFALLTFTTPIVAVMFPKIVQHASPTERGRAFWLALGTVLALAGAGALLCTMFPTLLLRIIYKPAYWKAAPLVPWFAWAMLSLTVANVLINNLLARERFAIVPWLVAIAVAYLATLAWRGPTLQQLAPFDAFRQVVMTLGAFNLLVFVVSVWFTRRDAATPSAG